MLLDIAFGLFLGKTFGLTWLGALFTLLPDIDFFFPKSIKKTTLFTHRGITHTPVLYLSIGIVLYLLTNNASLVVLFLVCTFFHLTHDLFVIGRGVMVAWPFSNKRLKIFPNNHTTGYLGRLFVWWDEEDTPMYTELSYMPNEKKKLLGLPETMENDNWFRDWYLRLNLFLFTEIGLSVLFFTLYCYV
jgi:hypothetical protein